MIPNSKDDMKELILNAAQDVFARFGFRKTTMDEIAQSIYKGKTSIYHYFKGKEQIFSEVLEKESRLLIEKIKNAVDGESTPQKKLRQYSIVKIRNLSKFPNLSAVLKDENIGFNPLAREMKARHLERELDIVTAIVREGVEKDIFRGKMNFGIVLKGIMVGLSGIETLLDGEEDTHTIEENVDEVMDLLLHGVLKNS